MDLHTIITVVTSVVVGASIILKTVAPLTENKIDDGIHQFLVKVMRVLSIDSDYNKTVKKIK